MFDLDQQYNRAIVLPIHIKHVSHTNGRSINGTFGVVVNHLVGMGFTLHSLYN